MEWKENIPTLIIALVIFVVVSGSIYLIYKESKTPDAYINGKPVKFVSRCIRSHVNVTVIPVTHYSGKSSYITMQPVTQYICDESIIADTVYLDQ